MLTMKIATWNLDYCCSDEIRAKMVSCKADYWVLTETRPDFPPGDGYELVACSPRHNCRDNQPDGRFVAIWIRDDFLDTGWKVISQRVLPVHESRMACIRLVQSGQRDIVVVGTVLPWGNDPQWPGTVGFCAALASQAVDWRDQWGDREAAFCVAGDFNQTVPYVRYFGSKKGADALDKTLGSLEVSCLSGHGNDQNGPRIDHICVSAGFRQVEPVQCWAKGKYGTDHAGVCAEVAIV